MNDEMREEERWNKDQEARDIPVMISGRLGEIVGDTVGAVVGSLDGTTVGTGEGIGVKHWDAPMNIFCVAVNRVLTSATESTLCTCESP